jgi:hypothetical protein
VLCEVSCGCNVCRTVKNIGPDEGKTDFILFTIVSLLTQIDVRSNVAFSTTHSTPNVFEQETRFYDSG